MRRWGAILACGAGLILAGSVQAAVVLYECKITDRDENVDWISDTVAFVVDGGAAASVVDTVILRFHEKPVEGRVRNRNGVLRITWNVVAIDSLQNRRHPRKSGWLSPKLARRW